MADFQQKESIQRQKLRLINQLTKVERKEVLDQLEELLQKHAIEEYRNSLKPMSSEEFHERLRQAHEDLEAGRVYTTEQVRERFGL